MALAGCGSAAATLTPPYCTVVAADMSDFSYISCPICNRTLPDSAEGVACPACGLRGLRGPAPSRVYRLFLSVATHDRVFPIVIFDRVARTLIGCPADELARFFAARPRAAARAADALLGEMFRVSLRASVKGSADHLRAVSIVPLREGFRPIIHTLRTLCG